VNRKKIIWKVVRLLVWVLVISGMTTLLIAANQKQQDHVCGRVLVTIKAPGEKIYIEESDIHAALKKVCNGSLERKPLQKIPLAVLEKQLEKNQWIRDAELYFDREDDLHVIVEEREPVARIFTTLGSSFYIDSSGHKMPLLENWSVRVPVVTGFTTAAKWTAADSALMEGVKEVCAAVYADPFWTAQVGQIDITPEKKFEIIPVVGDHVIRLGTAEDIHSKLDRLLLFYRKVLKQLGFNKYAVVDVQYKGQIIGVQKGAVSKVDSLQLQKNIEELLQKSTLQNVSDEMLPDGKPAPAKDSTPVENLMTVKPNTVLVKTNSHPPVLPVKTPAPAVKRSNPAVKPSKPAAKPNRPSARQPKAVMKKQTAAVKRP
jgi:cell division protein FtsQ